MLIVREAIIEDAEFVRRVAHSAWRDTYAGLLQPETIETFLDNAYSTERLIRRIERHVFLVAEVDGVTVAFADAVLEPDRVRLVSIYAHPEHRREGAGTALLAELRARVPLVPIAADVLSGNLKGERFYEARGFKPRETLDTDLFGEAVTERRWWLAGRDSPPG
ncbi:MAG: GNAT family N-acetyltransferase [Chloroflexi bacterium]|nr:GNAT family N-acetyltransferase [Chloroflexota bacterium]